MVTVSSTITGTEAPLGPRIHIRTASRGGPGVAAGECRDAASGSASTLATTMTIMSSSRLACTFTGVLNDKLRGFYRSTYTSTTTKKPRLMATTQFEPTDARRALPCWDEPAVKAEFDVVTRLKLELTRFSPAFDFLVVLLVCADRHVVM